MLEIKPDIYLVCGTKNAAIYDFNVNKLYSINDKAIDIIYKYMAHSSLSEAEVAYIAQLMHAGLLSDNFAPTEATMASSNEIVLSFVWLELTEGCNLHCVHCYEGSHHVRSPHELSTEQWMRVIDDIFSNGCKRIQITGGECLLRADLTEIISYAYDVGIKDITVFTNASLLSEPVIEFFADKHVQVRFSLYGHNSTIHDSVTQVPGSFDKTIRNVKKMISVGIQVTPAVVIMKQNENVTKEIEQFIIALGLKYDGYDVIREVFDGTQSLYAPTNQQIIDSINMKAPSFYISKEKFQKALSHNTCWYGKIAITPTGKVIPCIFERRLELGDITKQSISDILDSKQLRRLWNLDFSQIDYCKDCEFRFACKDCRPLAMAKCHDIKSKNPRCLYNPYTGMWNSSFNE